MKSVVDSMLEELKELNGRIKKDVTMFPPQMRAMANKIAKEIRGNSISEEDSIKAAVGFIMLSDVI